MPAAIAAVGEPGGSRLPSISTDPASQRSMPKIARATSVRPAPTRPGEGDDLAAPDVEGDVGEDALARQPLDLEHDAPRLGRHLREQRVHVAADHRPDHRLDRQLADRLRQDVATVAHHGDALADREDLLEPVRDEEHRVSARPQRLDDAEQPVDLRAGERGGRLVHHDHARVRGQRLHDLDQLLVGDREPARETVRVEPDAELVEDGGRLAAHPPAVDAAEALERLRADEDVLGDAQVGEERRLLEDDRDPRRLRLLGVVEDRLLAVEHEPARVGPVDAGEDLDERRLARAVLADEPVHLAARRARCHRPRARGRRRSSSGRARERARAPVRGGHDRRLEHTEEEPRRRGAPLPVVART